MPPRRTSLSEVGRRNIVYSDAEQIIIQNQLNTTKAGLLRLNTLRNNEAGRRRQLKDQIHRYKIALAPFKKIPQEIWMFIFELYCQTGQLSPCGTLAGQRPVVLTQVCSAWRQIVLSMPKLWSDVYLRKDIKIGLVRMWLRRAGNIPRALTSVPRPRCPNYYRPQTIQNFVCSFPFRKLHLTRSDVEGMDFTRIPVESLLLLEDLALLKPAWISPVTRATSFSPHHFPNLVSLRIDTGSMPRFHVHHPFMTWKKLRVLQLKFKLEISECLDILRDASSVEDCSLNLTLTSFYDQDPTVVANLKILTLSFSLISTLWSFLDHSTLPNLHTLILKPRDGITFQPSDRSSLLRLAPRSIGSLRSLKINHSYANVDVGLVLECLPLLQVLELHCEKLTTQTAEKIGRGELGGCLRELYDGSSSNLYRFL